MAISEQTQNPTVIKYRYTSVLDVSGTKSYRLSSRKVFGTYGGNEQNPSEEFRAFLIADEGYEIVQVDQSGAEALVVAHEASNGAYRELFKVGIKPHTYIALNLFIDRFRDKHPRDRYQFRAPSELVALPEWDTLNRFISEDPSNTVPYQLGKRTAHAKSYKMGPNTFRLNVLEESKGSISLSFLEAKSFLLTFEKLFPEIMQWQAELEVKLSNERILYNLFGYPRTFYGRWSPDLAREGISFIPQSTVGCLTSIVFTELVNYSHQNKRAWDLLINVHDAIVAQIPTNEVIEFAALAKSLFARPLTSSRGETFHMKSDAMRGPCWAKKRMTKVTIT